MDENQEPIRIKVKHKKQPRHHSVLEVLAHMITGLIVGVGVIYIAFPEVPLVSNLSAGIVITAIKFVINYFIRRYFANIERARDE